MIDTALCKYYIYFYYLCGSNYKPTSAMRAFFLTIFSCFFVLSAVAVQPQLQSNGYPYSQVSFTQVKVVPGSFWGQRLAAARDVTIPLAFSKCQSEHRYTNFSMAAYTLQHPGHAGLQTREWDVATFMGFPFDDTDVYKTIEGASYLLQTFPNEKLRQYIDSVLSVVELAQESDGYLYTARTINPEHPHPWSGKERWQLEEDLSHELYNLGHMVDAACAHYQATGSRRFLDIACRYADCVVRQVGPNRGQAMVVPGHQIAEMALCRLYLLTGERKYLDQAKFFLDYRGKTKVRQSYSQSDRPILEQKEAEGHAVRAGYMYSGIADVAALTGDSSYIKAIDTIWRNIVGCKYYITGGVGARRYGEAFGDNYELPNKVAYNETCAAISMVYLFERMFLLHGDSKYIDCLERTLYNGVLSGISVDGGRFFYPNPLMSDGKYRFNSDHSLTRQPWFGCACCPSNLSRFIPSVPSYIYAVRNNDLYVNLFAANTMAIKVGGRDVSIEQITDYPQSGDIKIRILENKAKNLNLKIRIPGWIMNQVVPSNLYSFVRDEVFRSFSILINGKVIHENELDKGYFSVGPKSIGRQLKKGDVITVHFDMVPQFVKANDKVEADRGRICVERGPLVYCAESADNDDFDVLHTFLTEPQLPSWLTDEDTAAVATASEWPKSPFRVIPNYAIRNIEANGSTFNVTALQTETQALETGKDGRVGLKSVKLTLIPYYAWCHRGATRMNVWFPCGPGAIEE